MTAYFTDIENVCNGGERPVSLVGDKLILVTGKGNYMEIPHNKVDVSDDWVQGKCFPKMGKQILFCCCFVFYYRLKIRPL